MCPCGIFLGAIPVFGERGLAQQFGIMQGRSLFKNRDERAARGRHMKRLDQMHLAVRFNDGFNPKTETGTAMTGLRRCNGLVGRGEKRR